MTLLDLLILIQIAIGIVMLIALDRYKEDYMQAVAIKERERRQKRDKR